MIKGIIFDLDNTLIDYMRFKTMSTDAAVSAMIGAGLNMDKEKAMKIIFELFKEYGIEDNRIFQKFLLKVNKSVDYKILSQGIVAYRKVRMSFLEPYPCVEEVLMKLKVKGLKLAIVSDAPRLKCWLRLAAMKITEFFDVVVTYDDTHAYKPSRLPFEVGLKQLGLKADEVMMVGDNGERDMVGAEKMGMVSVFAEYGALENKKCETSHCIKSVKEILELPEIKELS